MRLRRCANVHLRPNVEPAIGAEFNRNLGLSLKRLSISFCSAASNSSMVTLPVEPKSNRIAKEKLA